MSFFIYFNRSLHFILDQIVCILTCDARHCVNCTSSNAAPCKKNWGEDFTPNVANLLLLVWVLQNSCQECQPEPNDQKQRVVTVEQKKKFLLESAEEREKKQRQSWFLAARDGNDNAVAELLAATPTLIDAVSCGCTALHFAASNGRDKVVAQLLAAGSASLADAVDKDGTTALHRAAQRGHAKAVELLLASSPSSIAAADFDGFTALHYAVMKVSCKVVDLLLAACPSLLDVADEEGCTPLLHALSGSKLELEIVGRLLEANPKTLGPINNAHVVHLAISKEIGRAHV